MSNMLGNELTRENKFKEAESYFLEALQSVDQLITVDPEDRRKHNVAITAAGNAAVDRAEAELRRVEDEALAGLTADERTQLRKLLAKALDATQG